MAYEFTQDSYRQFSEAIIQANGDQATLTTILSDMQDTFTKSIADLAATTKLNEDIGKENDRLKQANMDLFLRIGTPQEPNAPKGEPEKPMSTKDYMASYFEKLDNAKGGK